MLKRLLIILICLSFLFHVGETYVLYRIYKKDTPHGNLTSQATYSQKKNGSTIPPPKKMEYVTPRFTDPAAKVAFYCSRSEPCLALLNNGEHTTLLLVGNVEKTWIILGCRKIPSQTFYEKYYRGNFPEAVAYIDLPE
jgi:outer membrane protein assembly factor BamE (lipoprotein component of BamABCDE complex)